MFNRKKDFISGIFKGVLFGFLVKCKNRNITFINTRSSKNDVFQYESGKKRIHVLLTSIFILCTLLLICLKEFNILLNVCELYSLNDITLNHIDFPSTN